jgi:hypothetical protein
VEDDDGDGGLVGQPILEDVVAVALDDVFYGVDIVYQLRIELRARKRDARKGVCRSEMARSMRMRGASRSW